VAANEAVYDALEAGDGASAVSAMSHYIEHHDQRIVAALGGAL
jgi:DNA-binding GntR family transcriptional regulator